MWSYIQNIYGSRYVLLSLFRQDLKNKYRNSILGVAWNFLTPLGIVTTIGIVYSGLFGVPLKELVPYLFSGLIPWMFFTGSAENGAFSFLTAQGFIKQTQVPIEIFPLRACLVGLVNVLFSVGAFLFVYLFISPHNFNLNMLLVIPGIAVWLVLCTAWATIAAIVNLYLRDFQPLQSLVLQGLFYVSPIIYKPEMLQGKHYEWIYKYNPFYYLLDIVRSPMLGLGGASPLSWLISLAFALLAMTLSIWLLRKVGRNISFRL